MKVLFFTREYPPYVYGGAGVHVEYLSQELAKLIPLEVRCFGDQKEKNDQLSIQGFEFDNLDFSQAPKNLQSVFKTLQTCIAMNAQPTDYDVVHCHTWYAQFAGIIAKLCYGIPLVITTHSLEPLRPWKREQLGKGYDMSSWIEKTALEMADAIIAVSEGTKKEVLDYFEVDESKIKVIYNGIDLQQYKAVKEVDVLAKYSIDPNQPYVLFVGRITRQKGILHLVNAIQHIHPDTQVVLCAGAPDTPEIAAEMKALVNKVQSSRPKVCWIEEMLDKKSIIQLYTHAAVFCCPSIYEPFGIINIEAMACETAVVASAVGGIKEVVVHGETGLLIPVEQQQEAPFEPVDPEQFSKNLAKGINQLITDKELRNRMAKNGRKRVEDHFDWIAIAQQVKSLYQQLIH